MSHYFAKLFKWLLFLAVCAGLAFAAVRFYQNRRLIFLYVGDQKQFFTEQNLHSGLKIGLGDRAAALSVYAPISLHGNSKEQNIQAIRFNSSDDMWAALESGAIDFALVSLDQFAKRVPLSPLRIAFPYAVSEGSDGIVCSSAWDKAQNGQIRHIACVTNSTGEYLAQVLADSCMDSPNPLQIVGAYNSSEAVELLRSGQVEALAVNQPVLGQLKANGYKTLAARQDPSVIEVCVLKAPATEARKQFMQKAIPQLAAIWFNRLDDLNNSPGPSYSSIAKASGIKRDIVRDTLRSGLHFYSYAEALEELQSGQLSNETMKLTEYWMMSGVYSTTAVRSLPDPDKFIFGNPERMQINAGRTSVYRRVRKRSDAAAERDEITTTAPGAETERIAQPGSGAAEPSASGTREENTDSGPRPGDSAKQPDGADSTAESQPTAVPLSEQPQASKDLSPFTIPKNETESSGAPQK